MLYPNELVIHDGNVNQHKIAVHVGPDGQPRAKGCEPRNYQTHPIGCYGAGIPHTAIDFPLIPRSEWSQRIKDQIAAGARNSDIRMRANNGQPIPSLDQDGRGYCWSHSSTSAVIMLRAAMNLPYVRLSAYAIACIIKNYRDEGGWGAESMDFFTSRGCPSVATWPEQSMSRSNDKPETWADAAMHKVTEGWVDLATAQYDRTLSFDQEVSLYLVNVPVVKDENWWSHSICGLDVVDGSSQFGLTRNDSGKLLSMPDFDTFWGMNDPVTAGYGVRIWNSWGESWGANGMGVLTGSQAVSDGAVAPRTTLAT